MKRHDFNYIWYPLTSFVEKEKENIRYKVAEKISPYIELNTTNMTYLKEEIEKIKDELVVEVNPFIRFNNIFQLLLHPDYEKIDLELRESLTNILLHLLGEIDLYLGQNKKDIIVKQMKKDIEVGAFGKKMKEEFGIFKEYEKHIIVDILYNTYCYLDMLEGFKKAIKMIYKDSIIYDNLASTTNLVIYLNYLENEENLKKVKFLKEMFLPIGLELDLFWEYHFGVIGVDITMRIGEIAVF